jgi:hypothetical protein
LKRRRGRKLMLFFGDPKYSSHFVNSLSVKPRLIGPEWRATRANWTCRRGLLCVVLTSSPAATRVRACARARVRALRAGSMRPFASCTPTQVLLPSRYCAWRVCEARIEWLCTQERWNPEVIIICGTAARCRWAKFLSSHDDTHPDNPTTHTRGRIAPTPAL